MKVEVKTMTRHEMVERFFDFVKNVNKRDGLVFVPYETSEDYRAVYAYMTVVDGVLAWQYMLTYDGDVRYDMLDTKQSLVERKPLANIKA